MAVEVNEDGFSTFRTGKHIDQMTMEEVAQIDKHIQSKISSLLSMSDFDPENKNHQLQMAELKADRDRIRERKSSFSTETASPSKNSSNVQEGHANSSQAIEGELVSESSASPVEDARKAQQEQIEKQMDSFVSRKNGSHSLDEGVIEGEFTDSSSPAPEETVHPVQEDLPEKKLDPIEEKSNPPDLRNEDSPRGPTPPDEPPKGPTPGSGDNLPARRGPGPGGPPSPSDVAKKSKLLSGRNLLGGAFVGYDAYSRIKDGENAAVAIAKAVGTNALFAALPGGLIGGLAIGGGVMVASMAPDLYDATEAKKAELSGKTNAFQTSFEESEGQIANQQQGMQQQQQAEQYALDRMRRHAQGAHSTY